MFHTSNYYSCAAGTNTLVEALAACRVHGAKLVVAKLDRLARHVAFLSALMESGVEFVFVDNPHATRFTIHILAAVAEQEALAISQRTVAALAAVMPISTRPSCNACSRRP